MSWVARDSEGRRIYRRRPLLNVTVSALVVQLLEELVELTGKDRSKIVDEILLKELPRMLEEVKKRLPVKYRVEGSGGPSLEEEFMKSLLFKGYKEDEWEQAG